MQVASVPDCCWSVSSLVSHIMPEFSEHLPVHFGCRFLRRSAIAEAAANASLPDADLATITAELDAYYHMVLHSFPRPA
jgi:hypothetical protein